jgi:hypothetical protein
MAAREDGEMVFIYKRPSWGTGQCGRRAFYELRSHGELIGKITSEDTRQHELKAEWVAEAGRPVNETDLLEIAGALQL